MAALIVLGALGTVALVLIYWALVFCARESGPAGKALAAGLGVAITGLAYGFLLFLGAAALGAGL
jgi:hypothetical protein